MPFVHVELIEGRTEEQLTNMVKDITSCVKKCWCTKREYPCDCQ